MKKTIALILLLLLIGTICFGCTSNLPQKSLSDQLETSQEESVNTDQEVEDSDKEQSEEDLSAESPDLTRPDRQPGSAEQRGRDGVNLAADSATSIPKESAGEINNVVRCIFSINCSTVFDNLDKIDESIIEILPEDGWIYPVTEIEFTEGESVFDILSRVAREADIHMESNSNPVLGSRYIEGIHNLYEFDAGELSGWTYKINDKGMGYGSSSSYPEEGDEVEWLYTCDQGRDVGVTP